MKKLILVIMAALLTACGGSEGSSAQNVPTAGVSATSASSNFSKRVGDFTKNPPAIGQTQMWGDSNTYGMFLALDRFFSTNALTNDPIQIKASAFRDQVYNAGISGITSFGFYSSADILLASQPKEVIMMLGTNDLSFGIPTFPTYEKILKKIIASGARPYVVSVLPRSKANLVYNILTISLNKKIKKKCDELGVQFIDTYAKMAAHPEMMLRDGIHYTDAGYLYHASLIASAMIEPQITGSHAAPEIEIPAELPASVLEEINKIENQ